MTRTSPTPPTTPPATSPAGELAESEVRLRIAAQCASDLIYEWDPDADEQRWFGNLDYWTVAAAPGQADEASHPGTPVPESDGRSVRELWRASLHPDDAARVLDAVERHRRSGRPLCEQYRVIHPDGSLRHWVDEAMPVRTPPHDPHDPAHRSGGGTRWIGAITDITEWVRAHEALRCREEELRLIVDSVPALVASVDRELRYKFHNRVFSSWFGLTGQEVAGRPMREVVGEAAFARLRPHVEAALRGEIARFEGLVEYALGGPRWVSATYLPRRDEDGRIVGALLFVFDISDRKKAEAERAAKRRVEEELERVRAAVHGMEQTLGVVAHELRTPIASLALTAEMLLMDPDPPVAPEAPPADTRGGASLKTTRAHDHREAVARMGSIAAAMSETIESLLEGARANSGRAAWRWGPVDLAAVAAEVRQVAGPLFQGKSVLFSLSLEPGLGAVNGDAGAIRRLLVNLIANACRHTTGGAVGVTIGRAAPRHAPGPAAAADNTGAWLVLRVSDTGSGMSRSELDRLGELGGHRVPDGPIGTEGRPGTGLGLAICRTIAAAHGGRIRIASAPGAGTEVTVWLRADLPAASAGAPLAAAAPIETSCPIHAPIAS